MDNNIGRIVGLGLIGIGVAYFLDKLFIKGDSNDKNDSNSARGGDSGKQSESHKSDNGNGVVINNIYRGRDIPDKKVLDKLKEKSDDKKSDVEPPVNTE